MVLRRWLARPRTPRGWSAGASGGEIAAGRIICGNAQTVSFAVGLQLPRTKLFLARSVSTGPISRSALASPLRQLSQARPWACAELRLHHLAAVAHVMANRLRQFRPSRFAVVPIGGQGKSSPGRSRFEWLQGSSCSGGTGAEGATNHSSAWPGPQLGQRVVAGERPGSSRSAPASHSAACLRATSLATSRFG
jgi:hypothetical protein